MRLVLDARKLDHFGIGRYVAALLAGLPQSPALGDAELIALVSSERSVALEASYSGWRVEIFDARLYSLGEQVLIPRVLRRLRADLFHAPHYATSVYVPCRLVLTVHDLIHVLYPGLLRSCAERLYARLLLRRNVRAADALIAPSESTRRALMQRFDVSPERITTIANGVAPPADCARSALPSPCRNHPFILFVGNPKPHKNLRILLEAFSLLPDDELRLVIAGGAVPDSLRAAPKERVIELGRVDDESLWALYRHAMALVLPSLHEGFGLTALEAMAVGTPVIASSAGALPELVSDTGLLVHPNDMAAWSEAIQRLQRDPALRERLGAAGRERAAAYTWQRTALETAECYRRVLAETGS